MKPESLATLETAIALTTDAGASLELVHVPAATVPPDVAAGFLEELLAKATHGERKDVMELARITTEPEGEGGNVAEMVRNLAMKSRADLVVIGRGAIRTGLGRLYANTYDIIRDSPCPVLSV
jgi:nucleotide-binding universal stress UspA family protein